jgi:hypothetical protein
MNVSREMTKIVGIKIRMRLTMYFSMLSKNSESPELPQILRKKRVSATFQALSGVAYTLLLC